MTNTQLPPVLGPFPDPVVEPLVQMLPAADVRDITYGYDEAANVVRIMFQEITAAPQPASAAFITSTAADGVLHAGGYRFALAAQDYIVRLDPGYAADDVPPPVDQLAYQVAYAAGTTLPHSTGTRPSSRWAAAGTDHAARDRISARVQHGLQLPYRRVPNAPC